jgi:hypothetical protein
VRHRYAECIDVGYFVLRNELEVGRGRWGGGGGGGGWGGGSVVCMCVCVGRGGVRQGMRERDQG